MINVSIYLLGDWLSQTVFRGSFFLDFDVSRTLKNGFIGLCFGPLVHYYYQFSDEILPVDVMTNRVLKIVMDQTIYLATKCSVYLAAVSLLNGGGIEEATDGGKRPVGKCGLRDIRLTHAYSAQYASRNTNCKQSKQKSVLC